MEKILPQRIVTDFINKAFAIIDLPATNAPMQQKQLADLYIANAMVSAGTARKKAIVTELKKEYKEELTKAIPNDPCLIEACRPFKLMVKVSNPRKSFDKETFIKEVADKFDISMTQLNSIANNCNKKSAAPVAFNVVIVDDNA